MPPHRACQLCGFAVSLLLISTGTSNAQSPSATYQSLDQYAGASVGELAAATFPAGFFEEPAAANDSSFASPVAVAFAPDGRIFVAEKRGRVYIIENGEKVGTPFINLEAEVLNQHDRGLLGLALHPDFATNGYVYLLYTVDPVGGDLNRFDIIGRLTRYSASIANPNVADLTTRTVMIGATYAEGIPNCYRSHAIGTVQFGHDNTLFVGSGDGASFNEVDPGGLYPDCFTNGMDPMEDVGAFRSVYMGSMSGKILRIDAETGLGLPSNPFYTGDGTDVLSKIWVSGLRNPYRYAVGTLGSSDPTAGDPGTLFIGDVGWGTWEDLNVSKSGSENFGWPCWEGPNTHAGYQAQMPSHSDCSTVINAAAPTYYWSHSNASLSVPPGLQANAIISGDVYSGTKYPLAYQNRLFYGDYTRGWISSSAVDTNDDLSDDQPFASNLGPVVDWRYNPYDEYIYFVNIGTAKVMRLRHDNENAPPVAVASATPLAGPVPLAVQFTGNTSFDPDGDTISYLWEFGDDSVSTQTDPQHTYLSAGLYQVQLTVSDPSGASSSDFVSISADNFFPDGEILSPANGTAFDPGDTVNLSATATDNEDPITSLQFDWEVVQWHNNHAHGDFFNATGQLASFPVEDHGVQDEVNFLEIILVVTDTGGLKDTTRHYIEVSRPDEVDITPGATPIAKVTAPTGSGNPDIGVIKDGIYPPVGSTDPLRQYDTNNGSPKSEDWIGYTFSGPRYLSRLKLQEGLLSVTGGWWDDMRVEVRVDSSWYEVQFLSSIIPYEGNNGENYGTYSLIFRAIWGDAVRLIGTPGGTGDFIGVGELRAFSLPGPPFNFLETVTASGVSSDSWTTVGLQNTYSDLVAVCSPQYGAGDLPAVVRLRNAVTSSFDIRLQNPSGSTVTADVHCLATNAGKWRLPDGRKLEAQKYLSTVTDHATSWVGEPQTYLNSYGTPAVFGQVMSYNDTGWSSFWSRGDSVFSAPKSFEVHAGKHVGEDPDLTRENEIVGIVVFEAGHGTAAGLEYETATGGNTILGFDSGATSYTFAQSFSTPPVAAVVSSAGMDGPNGGWPILYGASPMTSTSLSLVVDEDQLFDPERGHIEEEVSYAAFGGTGNLTLTVLSENQGPIITPMGPRVNAELDTISVQVISFDPDGDLLTFDATGLPRYLTINPASGEISGVVAPGATDAYLTTVRASDGGAIDSTQFMWTIDPATPEVQLAAELAGFAGHADGADVVLRWTTTSRTKDQLFGVEQEVDGSFISIGSVGTYPDQEDANDYSFRVADLDPGTHRFRLRHLSASDADVFSKVIEVLVEVDGTHVVSLVHPNPVWAVSRLRVAVRQEQMVQVKLYDVLGRSVRTVYQAALPSNAPQDIEISGEGLASGVYLLRIEGETFVELRQMVVSR